MTSIIQTDDGWSGPCAEPTRMKEECNMKEFKPASRQQIDEWVTWLKSPDAVEAAKKLDGQTEAAMRTWKNYKFDPDAIHDHIDGMWPAEKSNYKLGAMWLGYEGYRREQEKLFKVYNTIKDTVFDEAEIAYNTLMNHIREHGNIVQLKDMTRQHKQPLKKTATEAPKLGRRAARKVRNLSEKSTNSYAVRPSSKVTVNQGYEAND